MTDDCHLSFFLVFHKYKENNFLNKKERKEAYVDMPKRIENGKKTKRRKTFENGWTSNILKSLGYSAMDVITEIMPNASSTVSGIVETKQEVKDTSNIALEKAKELSAQMQSRLKEFREDDLREAIEDIKSGKLHGRMKDTSFGDDDFGGFDENFDFGEDGNPSDSSGNVTVNVAIDEESPMVEAQVATADTISNGFKTSVDLHKVGYASVASSIAKMSTGISNKLDLVHSEIAKISTEIPKSLTEHAYLSAQYYQDSIKYQKQISESLIEMKDLYAKSAKVVGEKDSNRSSSFGDFAWGMDISDYKDLVKKQLKGAASESMIGMSLNMFKDIYETKKMAAEGLGKTGIMETLTKAAMKNIIPSMIKESGKQLDELLGGLVLSGGMKIGRLSKRWDSPLLQFIGDAFGIKAKPDLTVDKKDYEKSAVAFDGKVHRAITDVIPSYLRMITSALTGKEEVSFDYEKGKFDTVRNIRDNFKKELRKSATNSFFSETWDFNSIVDSMKDISKEQNEEIKESFQDFIYNMVKSGDFATFRKIGERDDIAKFTRRSTDDPVVGLIREYFEGMVDQGRQNDVNDFFSKKTIQARQSLEEKHRSMTKDATTGNFNLINNGLTEKDQNKIRSTAEGGLLVDKYGRSSHSYLRDILGTLATGIKVVNVGTVEGNPSGILSYSDRILSQLYLDNNTLQMNLNNNTPSVQQVITKMSFNLENAIQGMEDVLRKRDYGDWLDDKAEYSDENKVSGKVFRSIKKRRDALKGRTKNINNGISNIAIDAIYGKRMKPSISDDDVNGPNDNDTLEDSPIDSGDLPNLPLTPTVTNIMVGDFHNKLKTMGNDFVNDIILPLNHSLFNDEDGLITQIEETDLGEGDKKNSGKNKEEDSTNKVSIKDTMKSIVSGEKNEDTGKYEKGLFSDVVNDAAEAKLKTKEWAHEMVYGSKDGTIKGINQYLRDFFGQKEDGSLAISAKAKEGFGAFREHFKKRSYEWTDIIFGPEEEGAEKKLDVFLGDMKGKKGIIGASAIVGALGSFFLPGGPIGGALIGSGIGMATRSTQLKDVLFGKIDDETGERVGGLITKEWKDYFKKMKKPMTIGAGFGLIGSFFLPGGPIMGSLIGAGLGLATKTEAFSDLMYGDGGTKADPTGGITKFIKEHYSKDKDVKSTFMDAGIGAGFGLIGSFFLPGGPIMGSLIGAASSIAINTDRFKDYFFGKEDEETKKREGGVLGDIKQNIMEKFHDAQDTLGLWVEENITNPLKVSMEPIKKRAKLFLFGKDKEDEEKGLVGKLADRLDQTVFGDLKRSIKENIIDKMKDGFHKLFGGFANILGTIIKSPFTAIRAYAQEIEEEDGNVNAVSINERIRQLNDESRKKREERKAKRRGEVISKNSSKTEDTTAKEETQESKVLETVPENIKETVQVAKEQLDVTKANHEETKGILTRISDAIKEKMGLNNDKPKQKKNDMLTGAVINIDEGSPVAAATGGLIGSHAYLDHINKIDKNVKRILNSVDGQLNGTGWNLNRIYKLLRKKLKDDDDGDEEGPGPFRRFYRMRDLLRGGKNKLKEAISAISPIALAKKWIDGLFEGVKDAIKTVLQLPKVIIGTVKQIGDTMIDTMLGALEGVANIVIPIAKKVGPILLKATGVAIKGIIDTGAKAIKSFAGLVKTVSKGLVKLFVGVSKFLGSVAKKVFGIGKNIAKTVVKGGINIAKSAANKLFHKKNDVKDKLEKHFVLDGGTLDTINTVNVVKIIEKIKNSDKSSDSLQPTDNKASRNGNIITFPGIEESSMVSPNENQPLFSTAKGMMGKGAAAIGGAFTGFRQKGNSILTRAKGSASSIRAKFTREDAEEKQSKWRDKITKLLTRSTETTEKHSSVWSSIFSKKGIITAGLILLAPFIIKAVKGIIGFFGAGGIGSKIADFLSNLGSEVGDDAKTSIDQEGGIAGIINNASEQTRAVTDLTGLTNRKSHKINPDGTLARDEDGNMVYEETKDRGLLGRVTDFYMPIKTKIDPNTGKAYNERVYNQDTVARTSATLNVAHKVANKMSKFAVTGTKADKKLISGAKKSGKYVISGVKKGGKALGGSIKKGVGKLASTDKVQTIIKFGKKAINFVIEKVGAAIAKHGGKTNGLVKIGKKVIDKVLNSDVISKFAGKFAKCFGKAASAAGTLLASEVGFVALGGIGGALNVAEVFEVNKEDVDWKMRLIAAALEAVLNTSMGSWFDVIADIFLSITGINLVSDIATAAYKAISDDEDAAKLDDARNKFDQEYESYVRQEYDAYAANEESAGNTPMTFDQFKGSDISTSKADYNVSENHFSVMKTMNKAWNGAGKLIKDGFNTVKGFGKSVATGFKNIFGGNKESIEESVNNSLLKKTNKGLYDADGGYYVVNSDGTYNYYNINGELVSENVNGDEVKAMFIKGLLTEGPIANTDNVAATSLASMRQSTNSMWKNAADIATRLFSEHAATDVTTNLKAVSGGKGDEESSPNSASGTVNGFPYYSQNDPSIKNKPYNLSSGESDTMGERGCGPTAMSMVASQLTGQTIDPVSMAKLATNNGFSTDVGTTPDYFQNAASTIGLSSQNLMPTKEAIEASLRNGNPVILQGQDSRENSPFTSGGHYVVGVGMNGDNLVVNDPRGKQYSKEYNVNDVLGGVQNIWGFSKGQANPMGYEDTTNTALLGMGGKAQGVAGDVLNGFPYLLQGDDRWGGTMYSSTGDPSQTIASSACGPTSMAMVLRSYGANVSPVDTAQYALDNGYRTASTGTSWGFFNSIGSKYGLTTTQSGSAQDAINSLQNGMPVIASMGPSTFTKGGHYIVLSGINGEGKVVVNDPGKLARSNVTYDPSVFANEGKQFWSFSKDGKGSIDNVVDAGEIKVSSTVGDTTGSTAPMRAKKNNRFTKITEGTPEGGVISESQAESADGSNTASSEPQSILDFLGGAAKAFLSPIMDVILGRKTENEENANMVTIGGNVPTDENGNAISSSSGQNSSVGTNMVSTGLSYVRNGDYLGKYTAQFESGDRGPTAISSGVGDHGGVSFGTYQFATGGSSEVASDSQLARFWNANYAANHPGVVPGNNQAFKDAWLYEANADPKGFQDKETAFMADNFYRPQVSKISSIIDPDSYDRGLQEDIYATSIQFGPRTSVVENALKGKDVSNMNPKDVINAIQDYKVANNATLFASSSQKIRDAAKHRHDETERQVMLSLAGKQPINPTQVAVDETGDGVKVTDAKSLLNDTTSSISPIANTLNKTSGLAGMGGFGDRPRISHKNMPKSLIGGKGEDNSNVPSVVGAARGITTSTPSIKPSSSFKPTVASKEAGNVLLNQVIELLGYIVENTYGINTGVQELYNKDFGSTQLIANGGNNSIIPLNQKGDDDVDPRSTRQYQTAKQMSAGTYFK